MQLKINALNSYNNLLDCLNLQIFFNKNNYAIEHCDYYDCNLFIGACIAYLNFYVSLQGYVEIEN